VVGLLVILFTNGQDEIDTDKHSEHQELPEIVTDVV